jgi:hypothetical protein
LATLLFLGPAVDGNRDTYRVEEDIEVVSQALNGPERFVPLTDPGDGQSVWFRVEGIRYFYAD